MGSGRIHGHERRQVERPSLTFRHVVSFNLIQPESMQASLALDGVAVKLATATTFIGVIHRRR